MTLWQRHEPWCAYVRRRRRQRAQWLRQVQAAAVNQTSKRLAERLDKDWNKKGHLNHDDATDSTEAHQRMA